MRWPWSRDEPARAAEPPRTVCMFLDDSPGAERAFRWAQRNLVDPKRDRRAPAAMRCASASHAAGAHAFDT